MSGFTCQYCGWTSHNPHDAEYRYCGHCNVFVDEGFAMYLYLRNCTDAQVQGVYDKEWTANRLQMAQLAVLEAKRRGITLRTNYPKENRS